MFCYGICTDIAVVMKVYFGQLPVSYDEESLNSDQTLSLLMNALKCCDRRISLQMENLSGSLSSS